MNPRIVKAEIDEIHMKIGGRFEEVRGRTRAGDIKEETSTGGTNTPKTFTMKSSSSSPVKSANPSQSPSMDVEKKEETVGGDITVKLEPGKPPKLSRSSSHKLIPRPAPLYDHYPDQTKEAKGTYQVIPECLYSNKYIGSTEHGMECDCADEWGKFIQAPIFLVKVKNLMLFYRCCDQGQRCVWGRL